MEPVLLFLARIGLGLEQEDVAKAAGISVRSLQRLEADAGQTAISLSNLRALQATLEAYGVKFLGDSQAYGPGLLFPAGFPQDRPKGTGKPRLRSVTRAPPAKSRAGKSSKKVTKGSRPTD